MAAAYHEQHLVWFFPPYFPINLYVILCLFRYCLETVQPAATSVTIQIKRAPEYGPGTIPLIVPAHTLHRIFIFYSAQISIFLFLLGLICSWPFYCSAGECPQVSGGKECPHPATWIGQQSAPAAHWHSLESNFQFLKMNKTVQLCMSLTAVWKQTCWNPTRCCWAGRG